MKHANRRIPITTKHSKSDESDDKDDSPSSRSSTPMESTGKKELTAQELILQEALGITPESKEDQQRRQQEREEEVSMQQTTKTQNVMVAILAFLVAILNYAWQYTHPITSTSLLVDMQRNSSPVNVIGSNGKPTVIDFWAPWCENCKKAAPTLFSIEEEYKSKVNFVMVNGDLDENWGLIERLGVDAIPHLCMVSSDGVVETALIGPIPKSVLRADLDVMLENARLLEEAKVALDTSTNEPQKIELPYQMYDAFRKYPELRKLKF